MSTTTPPSQSLTELLGQLSFYLNSENGSALTETELLEIDALLRAFPIEVSELRASPKQRDFQRRFFNRADDDGRLLDIFVAMGANRSGKTVVGGGLCFCKYVRDKARDGDLFWCIG